MAERVPVGDIGWTIDLRLLEDKQNKRNGSLRGAWVYFGPFAWATAVITTL